MCCFALIAQKESPKKHMGSELPRNKGPGPLCGESLSVVRCAGAELRGLVLGWGFVLRAGFEIKINGETQKRRGDSPLFEL